MRTSKTKVFVTGLVLFAVGSLVTVGTVARFTDSDDVTGNTFTTKTISLTLDDYTAVWTITDMMPGDSTTVPIVVTNAAGSEPLRYSISSSATDSGAFDLKDELDLTVREIDATLPATPCDDFDGAQLYAGDLDSAAGLIVGDATQGDDTGDRVLAAGASETLCVRVALPLATGNDYKELTTTATFTFASEQTENNP